MPDLLDRLLEEVATHEKRGSVAMIKTGDGYRSVPASSIDEDWGGAVQVSVFKQPSPDGTDLEIPLYEIKVTEADKKAQEDRSATYGISIHSGYGSVTMPKKWKDAGLTPDDFADPVHFKYPVHDESHARNALSRWSASGSDEYAGKDAEVVYGRIVAACKKFGIEVSDDTDGSKGAGAQPERRTVGGVTFGYREDADGLGRTIYRFTYGDADMDGAPTSFVYNGSVATLRAPKGTSDTEVRRLLGILVTGRPSKSALPKQLATFQENLEDAMEGLSGSAIYACINAFCNSIMDWWTGSIDEDIDDETFTQYADQLAAALKDTWGKYVSEEQKAVEIVSLKRAMSGRLAVKAGAAISRANRDRLNNVRTIIAEILGDEEDAKATGGGQTSKSAARRAPHSELSGGTVQEGLGSEVVARLQAEIKGLKDENRELAGKVAERDHLIEVTGKTPLPDPMAGAGQPGGEHQPVYGKAVTTGNTIYDIVDQHEVE